MSSWHFYRDSYREIEIYVVYRYMEDRYIDILRGYRGEVYEILVNPLLFG